MMKDQERKCSLQEETNFYEVAAYLEENNTPLANISACATDGAPSMIGIYKGFIVYSKKAIPGVFCIHCVIHANT